MKQIFSFLMIFIALFVSASPTPSDFEDSNQSVTIDYRTFESVDLIAQAETPQDAVYLLDNSSGTTEQVTADDFQTIVEALKEAKEIIAQAPNKGSPISSWIAWGVTVLTFITNLIIWILVKKKR